MTATERWLWTLAVLLIASMVWMLNIELTLRAQCVRHIPAGFLQHQRASVYNLEGMRHCSD